ncbi:MAG: hypothetical protein B6242_04630 [Anaerolineaceae bacterium 4572_78]|nr:MAG: hypothetical protein B6242_04630 [Anaerolineaceae bacterium 4572_78]
MTQNLRPVAIGEIIVSNNGDDVLVAYGLGSCVAVCMYDPMLRVGSMLHALLPTKPSDNINRGKPTKFVDEGISLLLKQMQKVGGKQIRYKAYLCGGAQMLSIPNSTDAFNIGQRNIEAAETMLKKMSIVIQARDTGGKAGRTVKLYVGSGQVTVRTLGHKEHVLA